MKFYVLVVLKGKEKTKQFFLLFHPLGSASVPETLGKGIVVDLELGNLLILIGCHGDEVALLEDVGAEGGVGQLHDVAGSHQVEPGLVLVHRVQDGLRNKILLRSL